MSVTHWSQAARRGESQESTGGCVQDAADDAKTLGQDAKVDYDDSLMNNWSDD